MLVVCFCAASPVALAGTSAILVGVSDYDDSIGLADLRGPANDVALMAEVLRGRGVSDITVLGGAAGPTPTRAAILKTFAERAEKAGPGDLVYIHLSGHGTRQADTNSDETDGLDEVFLPADTGRAEPGKQLIPNAIVDDEIGQAVRAIRAKGANVWLVMDSCHSGSGVRAGNPGVAARFVDPATLGISVSESIFVEAGSEASADEDLPGGLIAFYAARSSEVAREANMAPVGSAEEEWYGLLTSIVAARLSSGQTMTYRQLYQSVLSDLNESAIPGVARLQTPTWEGGLIDAVVFGGADTIGTRRFAVEGEELRAGLIHGIAEGTLVALYAQSYDKAEARLGLAQTEDTEATLSYLRRVEEDCRPDGDSPCPAMGSLPNAARFAEVVARPVNAVVTLAPPRGLRTGEPVDPSDLIAVALADAIDQAMAEGGVALRLDASAYDVETVWDGERMWFGPAAAVGAEPVGLSWTPGAEPLAPLLVRIARAESFGRTLNALAGSGSLLNPSPVEIALDLRTSNIADLAAPSSTPPDPRRECRAAVTNAMTRPTVPLERRSELKQCDQVMLSARGAVPGDRDVNRVFIDAHYCIHADYERIEGMSQPREVGGVQTICSDCPGGSYAAGNERVFVIVTESPENAAAINLEGLVENCAGSTGTRSAARSQALELFENLAARPGTRGSFGSLSLSDIWVERFDWTVLPRARAFRQAGIDSD